jgi:magnesium-transporting ATPase (P-type)
MPIHHPLTFPLLMTIAAFSSLLSVIAVRKNTGPWFVPLWSRKREAFTGTGWRYRTWSVWCAYLFIAVVAADQLFA